jgi:hypothetical protein
MFVHAQRTLGQDAEDVDRAHAYNCGQQTRIKQGLDLHVHTLKTGIFYGYECFYVHVCMYISMQPENAQFYVRDTKPHCVTYKKSANARMLQEYHS